MAMTKLDYATAVAKAGGPLYITADVQALADALVADGWATKKTETFGESAMSNVTVPTFSYLVLTDAGRAGVGEPISRFQMPK